MNLRIALACLGLALPLFGCGVDPHGSEPLDETRATMSEIFASMRVLLPMSAEPERFRNAENQAEISAALRALADNTHALESHVSAQDIRFSYLARNVAKDAEEVRRTFEAARY